MTLLILRPGEEAEKTALAFKEKGFQTRIASLTTIVKTDSLFNDETYDAVIFTSKHAIKPTSKPVFCVGETLADLLKKQGVTSIIHAETGEILAQKINASPYKHFLWATSETRAVDLQKLCANKQIDIVILYEITPLTLSIDTENLTGILHYSAKHAEMFFKIAESEKTRHLPHFCLSKRIENTLPKGVNKMSAEPPTENALIALVEKTLPPDEKPSEILPKPKSDITKYLVTAVIATVFGAASALGVTYFFQNNKKPPELDVTPITNRLSLLENKPVSILPDYSKDIAALRLELKDKSKPEAVNVDLSPIEAKITALEQKQTTAFKVFDRYIERIKLQDQFAANNEKPPNAASLFAALKNLKFQEVQAPQNVTESVLTGLKSMIKVTKTGNQTDPSLKDVEKALIANNLTASLTAWTGLTDQFRQLNQSFEKDLIAAIANEKIQNDLKLKIKTLQGE